MHVLLYVYRFYLKDLRLTSSVTCYWSYVLYITLLTYLFVCINIKIYVYIHFVHTLCPREIDIENERPENIKSGTLFIYVIYASLTIPMGNKFQLHGRYNFT